MTFVGATLCACSDGIVLVFWGALGLAGETQWPLLMKRAQEPHVRTQKSGGSDLGALKLTVD